MIETVRAYIQSENLLQPNASVILGLSGGMDSMALIDILTRLGYRCVAAHCNFHLRGRESDRDAGFVKQWCEENGISLTTVHFDTHRHADENRISIEMAARELRYNWFESVRQLEGAEAIAVAHHRDDSVETVLLNLVRGTGIKGMTGIAPKNRNVVRPLLCVTRSDIEAYVSNRKIPYVTDSTNEEDIYVRNMIRLRIIPALEKINPKAKEAILRTSSNLAEVNKIYTQSIEKAHAALWVDNKIDIRLLKQSASPQAVMFELLSPLGFSPSSIQNILESMDGEPGKQFYSEGYRLIKDREFFILDTPKEDSTHPETYRIDEGVAQIDFPVHLTLRIESMPVSIRKETRFLYMDADKVVFPLTIRRWRPGDWFMPFGMKGRKKLSDLFTNKKFSLKEKEDAWVLLSGDQIAWVIGVRSDDRFRISGTTRRVLVIEYCS